MQRLNDTAIWQFFNEVVVGRLATHDHETGVSELTPVLFAHDHGRIYFMTQPGRKLTLLRRYPAGVGLQCDQQQGPNWVSVYGWGRYRDVTPGREFARASWLLARKYQINFVNQVMQQARKALSEGPQGVVQALIGATTGCIDLERVGGRSWSRYESA